MKSCVNDSSDFGDIADQNNSISHQIHDFSVVETDIDLNSSSEFINQNKKKIDLKKKKNLFSLEEDEYLKYLINILGKNDWPKIAEGMTRANYVRNARQCRDRYLHYLDSNLNNDLQWSSEEDQLLINCVSQIGNKWKMFEQNFPGRTEVSLRNRYNLLIRKNKREQKEIYKKKNNSAFELLNCFEKLLKNHSSARKKEEVTQMVPSVHDSSINEFENESNNLYDFDSFLNDDFDTILDFDNNYCYQTNYFE